VDVVTQKAITYHVEETKMADERVDVGEKEGGIQGHR
jgi:hypothetical protein